MKKNKKIVTVEAVEEAEEDELEEGESSARETVGELKSDLRYLVDYYYQVQKHRIEIGNQIGALARGGEKALLLEGFYEELEAIEKRVQKVIAEEVKTHRMFTILTKVKGIGPVFAAGLLSRVEIDKAQHASSLWKFCGLAPGQRKVKGEKIDYDPWMKTLCWKIGESFIKTKGEYRKIYETSKAFYQTKFPKEVPALDSRGKPRLNKEGKVINMYTKMHIHRMASRRTVKIFLARFWASYRALDGLEVSEPFAHRISGARK